MAESDVDAAAPPAGCFPHIVEFDIVLTEAHPDLVSPRRVRQIMMAWRRGYLDASDPSTTEFSPGPVEAGQLNYQKPVVRAYRNGFRQRRFEMDARSRQRR